MEDGPLARIFADKRLRLAPAKGAARFRDHPRFAGIYDQTYFAHALNVAVTAGLLFEASIFSERTEPTESEMRVVLAAGALHDFDKLAPLAGGLDLVSALRHAEVSKAARALLEGFLPDTAMDGVFHLATGTEVSDRAASASFATALSPRRATLAAWCLQLADKLAGNESDPNDPERYRHAIDSFRRQSRALPEIQVQPLALLPQASLSRAARRLLVRWIREQGTLLHETESYVSWIGPRPSEKDIEAMDEALWSAVRPDAEVAFDKAGISHNSVRTSWTRFVDPTPESVKRWIAHHGGRLVVWQGDWGPRHFEKLERDLPGVFQYEPPPKNRVLLVMPDDDPDALDQKRRPHRLAKLVIAHCVRLALSDAKGRALPPAAPTAYDVEGLQGVMTATVPGILWARAERDDAGAYDRAVQAIAGLLRAERATTTSPTRGIVQALLGKPALPKPAATGAACIYCGAASDADVEDALVFGLKPTAWAPRKKGVQRETQTGRICEPCILENLLRDEAARKTKAPASDKGHLTVHLHSADLVCDVKWRVLAPRLQVVEEETPEGEPQVILFPKGKRGDQHLGGQLVPLRGHVSVPIAKPAGTGTTGETLAYLYRLRDCLLFVRDTSFKLHVSPLGLTPAQERAQFRWTNAPRWMEDLHLAEVHVDRLLDESRGQRRVPHALRVVEALIRAGREAGGSQGHRSFILHLMRNTLSVYDLSDRSRAPPQDPDHFLNVLEDAYMPEDHLEALTRAALAYIHFNARGSWSNNTWTWATRDYLDLRDKYGPPNGGKPLSEAQVVLIIGELRAAAERKWKGAPTDRIEEFVNAMGQYLADFRPGKPLTGEDRRVVINAISHLARKNYRSVFPKEIPA